jgi:hypothetical protein
MTEETNTGESQHVEGVQQPSIEDLQGQLTKANAEAAKERNIRKQLQAERDAAKKAPKENSSEDDYKALWAQEREKAEKLLNKTKAASIESTVKAKLSKAGVLPDAIDAAAKLLDAGMVQWDEDDGVDEVSAQAAVAKLKSQFGFMFEKKVSATDPKHPADNKNNSDKTMSRSQFDSLSPQAKVERMQNGWKLFE